MPDSIRDGKGRGTLAEVDDEGRFIVDAHMRPHISHHSVATDHHNSFNSYFKHNQISAATDEYIGYIKYTGEKLLVISSVTFTTDSAGMTKFELFSGASGESGGAATTPTNLYSGSNKTISSTNIHSNDGASPITISTAGNEILDIRIGWQTTPTFYYDTKDSIVLGTNDIFSILCNSAADTDVIRATVQYYEEDIR